MRSPAVAGAGGRRTAIRKCAEAHDPVVGWCQAVIGGRRNRAYLRERVLDTGQDSSRPGVLQRILQVARRRAYTVPPRRVAGPPGPASGGPIATGRRPVAGANCRCLRQGVRTGRQPVSSPRRRLNTMPEFLRLHPGRAVAILVAAMLLAAPATAAALPTL